MQSSTQGRTYTITAESFLKIDTRSTLPNPIRGRAGGLSGMIVATVENDQLVLDPPPSMRVTIPIVNLKSGNEFQDREARKMISSPQSPNIFAELHRAEPGRRSGFYNMQGAITIKGSTQQYDAEVSIRVDGTRITFDGSQKIDIRKFGIMAPRILMVQIFPEIDVTMHLVAELAD